jgi:hypothetical protein
MGLLKEEPRVKEVGSKIQMTIKVTSREIFYINDKKCVREVDHVASTFDPRQIALMKKVKVGDWVGYTGYYVQISKQDDDGNSVSTKFINIDYGERSLFTVPAKEIEDELIYGDPEEDSY